MNIRLKLAVECDAPFLLKEGCLPRVIHSVDLKYVTMWFREQFSILSSAIFRQRKSFAKALYLNKNHIPEERKQFLQQELLKHYPPGTEVTEELLLDAIDTETGEVNSEYSAHGVKVVEYYKNSPGGLITLENIWREHFVTTMQPKYLPDLWSMNHTTERLTIRATEGRIEEGDLKVAGLGNVKIVQ